MFKQDRLLGKFLSQQAGNGGDNRVVFDDSNFPSMGNTETPAFGPGFGAAFAQRTAPRPEDFPALPGLAHLRIPLNTY